MSYEITIKEKRYEKQLVAGDWGVIGTREVERDTRYLTGAAGEQRTRIEDVRGEIPEREKSVLVEREVLKQTVDTLDLAAVIRAVNNL